LNITNLKFIPYIIIAVLLGIIFIQRSCAPACVSQAGTHDTVRIKGDKKLVVVQDTVLMPGVTRWKRESMPVDSGAIITEYCNMLKAHTDTVKGNDVIVTIHDSMPTDSTIDRKVSIQNKRIKETITPPALPKFKAFIGFDLAYSVSPGLVSAQTGRLGAGPSLTFLTKSDNLYRVSYDFINNAPGFGMAWKIHFGK